MELKPVKNHKTHYPHRSQVNLNELLLTYKPNRWKSITKTPTLTTMLLVGALASTGLTGCTSGGGIGPIDGDIVMDIRKMNMAPIFEIQPDSLSQHPKTITGQGDATPLTDDMAFAIIQSELERLGLSGTPTNRHVPVLIEPQDSASPKPLEYVNWEFDLEIQCAYNRVYAEFLPQVEAETPDELSQRQIFSLPENPKEAATALRDQLIEVDDPSTAVVFYAHDDATLQEQNLRAQVIQFVEWLKVCGLI
ncbi:MAG: hypothetical protein FWG40_06130 [Peptococcaceae bacterium]|nr:hypothetical protein [Peptococcaceae bacterium]